MVKGYYESDLRRQALLFSNDPSVNAITSTLARPKGMYDNPRYWFFISHFSRLLRVSYSVSPGVCICAATETSKEASGWQIEATYAARVI